MKKLSIISVAMLMAVTALLFSSCKKDDKEPDLANGAVVAVVDGTKISFDLQATATRTSVNNIPVTSILATNKAGNGLVVTIYADDLKPDVYEYTHADATEDDLGIAIVLVNKNEDPYTSTFEGNKVKVTITSITATAIKGTFSGQLAQLNNNGTIGKRKTITNGEFNVTFQK